MIDEKEFARLQQEYEKEDALREDIIKRSRDILKASKHAIYSLQRDEEAEAVNALKPAEKLCKELIAKAGNFRDQGALTSALEEYVEAKTFLHFVQQNKLLRLKDLPGINSDEYLSALSDLTGELMRRAVLRATKKDRKAVEQIHALVEGIYGQLSQFDFRNSELRRKYDSVKYNLQKIENVLYDLTLVAR